MLFGPDRRKAHHHFGLVDAINRHSPDLGKRVVARCVDPLLPVLDVLPSRHPINVDLLCHLFKGWYLLARIEPRVQTLLGHTAIFQSAFSCLVDRDNISPAQTKISPKRRAFLIFLPFDDNAYNPAPCPRRINDEIKTVAITMPPSAKVLDQLLISFPDSAIQNTTFSTTQGRNTDLTERNSRQHNSSPKC